MFLSSLFIICKSLFWIFLSPLQEDNNRVEAKVYYYFEHIDDTRYPDVPFMEDQVVYLGVEESIHKSFTAEKFKGYTKDFVANSSKYLDAQGRIFFDTGNFDKDVSIYEYYLNRKTKQHFLYTHIFDTFYIIEDTYEAVEWDLMNETKIVEGYSCQLAKTHFKGRDYEVWFTTEIPISAGPWLLHGLPGLILEASDSNHEVKWTFKGFEKMNENLHIQEPINALKISKKQFERLMEAASKNPNAARKAAQEQSKAAGNFGLSMDNSAITLLLLGDKLRNGQTVSKIVNNPIDKTKN